MFSNCLANTEEVGKKKIVFNSSTKSIQTLQGRIHTWTVEWSVVLWNFPSKPSGFKTTWQRQKSWYEIKSIPRVIIFQPLKLLPVLKKWEIRIITSKYCKNSPVSSCNIPMPGTLTTLSTCTTTGAGTWPTDWGSRKHGSSIHQWAERKMHRGVILSSGKKAGGLL